MLAGVGLDLTAVHRHSPQLDQSRLGRDPRHLSKQFLELFEMTLTKLRHRPVGWKITRRQHSNSHVLIHSTSQFPRRERSRRVPINQDLHHHPRIKRPIAPPVPFVRRVESTQIQLIHRFGDKVGQMIFRQPISRGGGSKKLCSDWYFRNVVPISPFYSPARTFPAAQTPSWS